MDYSTENQKYLSTREEIEAYEFKGEIKRINDSTINFPIDINVAMELIDPDYALLDFNKDATTIYSSSITDWLEQARKIR